MSVNEIVELIELRTQQQKKPQGGHGTTAESSSSSSPESSLSCTSELDAVSSSYVGGGLVLLTPSNASEEKTRAAGPQQQHVDFGFDLSAIDHLNWTWPEGLGGGEGTSEGLWSGLRDLAGDSRELDGIDQVSMEWVGEWQSPWQ